MKDTVKAELNETHVSPKYKIKIFLHVQLEGLD